VPSTPLLIVSTPVPALGLAVRSSCLNCIPLFLILYPRLTIPSALMLSHLKLMLAENTALQVSRFFPFVDHNELTSLKVNANLHQVLPLQKASRLRKMVKKICRRLITAMLNKSSPQTMIQARTVAKMNSGEFALRMVCPNVSISHMVHTRRSAGEYMPCFEYLRTNDSLLGSDNLKYTYGSIPHVPCLCIPNPIQAVAVDVRNTQERVGQ
jgi:hypothetical protein